MLIIATSTALDKNSSKEHQNGHGNLEVPSQTQDDEFTTEISEDFGNENRTTGTLSITTVLNSEGNTMFIDRH